MFPTWMPNFKNSMLKLKISLTLRWLMQMPKPKKEIQYIPLKDIIELAIRNYNRFIKPLPPPPPPKEEKPKPIPWILRRD